MIKFSFLAALLIGLVSCSSTDNQQMKAEEQVVIPEEIFVDQKHYVAGTNINYRDRVHLRSNENLKSYKVNRYIDPNDPSLMHEAHIVYRIENGSNWNLQGDEPNNPPYGGTPKWGYIPQEQHLRASLETKSQTMSAEYTKLQQMKEDTAKLLVDFKQLTATSKYLAQQNNNLAFKLNAQQKENELLKQQLDNLVKNYQELMKITKNRNSNVKSK